MAALTQGEHHSVALEVLEHRAELAFEVRRVPPPQAIQARDQIGAQRAAELLVGTRSILALVAGSLPALDA